MAFSAFVTRRLIQILHHQTQYRSTLASHPSYCRRFSCSSSNVNVNTCQAFRRSPSHTLLHSLYIFTFHPYSAQSFYNPIDFSDIVSTNNQNDELAAMKLVELVQKTKDYTSKREAIDFVTATGVNPDAKQVNLAIWKLRNDWALALLAFQLNQKRGFITEKLLGLIVWVLGTHQKFDIAWSLIRDWHRFVGTQQAMLAIIERYVAANSHEKAIKTFNFMEKLTISPDQNAFRTVISVLCCYGNIEEAEEFMLINKKLFPLETADFNIILRGWCNLSVNVFEAKRVWREMATNCVTPDALSYTHMIFCFSRVGNLFDSLRMFDEMKKQGWIPSLDVYNSLIYVMAHEKCFSEASKVLQRIQEAGLQPDSMSYNCLICPLCAAGEFKKARELLSVMTQEGARPTIETYHAFLRSANLEETFEMLSQMRKHNVDPENSTFILIFDRFFKIREPENVLKVWVEMRDFGVPPELEHYKSLISGLANCGCLLKAKELHTEMLSNGFVDDPKLQQMLQGPEQVRRLRKAGSMKFVRIINKSKSLHTFHSSPCRGRKNRVSKWSKKQRHEGPSV
ncbi:hypothetical protein RDABS01_017108 [Bienertia sinuspersici]